MKKEILRLMTKYIELLCQCGYAIDEVIKDFKQTPYKDLDTHFIKGRINWLIKEYQMEESNDLEKI